MGPPARYCAASFSSGTSKLWSFSSHKSPTGSWFWWVFWIEIQNAAYITLYSISISQYNSYKLTICLQFRQTVSPVCKCILIRFDPIWCFFSTCLLVRSILPDGQYPFCAKESDVLERLEIATHIPICKPLSSLMNNTKNTKTKASFWPGSLSSCESLWSEECHVVILHI